ncbi:type VI secretion system baseplate subunit TssG [Sandaracinus amylolyticus]|uniref:Type VI secretion system baseplate subunit TssG n=1 Tax=Sandaracinus amylolyticus TaxID=927083 RepID=A0A0F6YK25_9BACT|nr:type VI secretion system baseplate subunit TssG [Sandaracinus amylolyticus]AKF08813.1 Hypothetical protein DB32_005962 [Sandaracinus amylolyticus]
MDAADGHAVDPLSALHGALATSGRRASFFALVAALERRLGSAALGTEARPADERVRLGHSPALTFAASDVSNVALDGDRARVESTFLGTAGTIGPLPLFMLEEIAAEDPDRAVRRDLLDVFHHRALSLLYRSVQRLRPSAVLRDDGSDFWSRRLVAAAGADASALTMPERIAILPLLATSRRSALGFQRALQILVRRRVPAARLVIEIRELAGDRVPIAERSRMRLGRSSHALGRETVLGANAADPGGRCVVVIRGLDATTHPRCLPGGDLHALARETFRLFDPAGIELELELHVDAQRSGFPLSHTTGLGHRTWLASARTSRTVRVAA